MVCGDVASLSVMVTDAVMEPTALGAKSPWITQVAPTARVAPQVFPKENSDALAPVTAMLLIDNVELPVLVTMTVSYVPVEPTTTGPKTRLVGVDQTGRLVADRVTPLVAATPVPLSGMLCGEL